MGIGMCICVCVCVCVCVCACKFVFQVHGFEHVRLFAYMNKLKEYRGTLHSVQGRIDETDS